MSTTSRWSPQPSSAQTSGAQTSGAQTSGAQTSGAQTSGAQSGRPKTPTSMVVLRILPLVLIVATEYKFRRRPIDDVLGGQLDLAIILELGIYALVGAFVVLRLNRGLLQMSTPLLVMWGYIVTTAVSSIYAPFPPLAAARSVQLVIIGLVIHLIANTQGLDGIARIIHGYIVLITLSIGGGLAWVAPVPSYQVGRFTWLYVHTVVAGTLLALSAGLLFAIVLAAGSARERYPWPDWVYRALFAVHLGFLLLTQTRGSVGATIISLAVMAWLRAPRFRAQLSLISFAALAGVALTAAGPLAAYAARGEDAESLATFNRRTEIWTLAWESFLERPLHGLGFTAARGVFFEATTQGGTQKGLGGAHNAFVNVLADVGLIGVTWWLLVIGTCLMGFHRLRGLGASPLDLIAIAGVMTSLIVNSMTTEFLGAGVTASAMFLFLVVAWIVVLQRDVLTPTMLAPAQSQERAREQDVRTGARRRRTVHRSRTSDGAEPPQPVQIAEPDT